MTGSAAHRLLLILGLAGLLFLPSLWTRDLWSPDEPKYAEAAREMALSGDFVLPTLNGEDYFEKPPLFLWLTILAEAIPGVPYGSGGRLVTILAGIGTLLLTWRLGALLMGEATGTLAAILLSGTLLFWNLTQSGVIDPLLTFFCTLALYGFARHRRGRRRGMLLFYAACSMGVLAKGPVGILIPGLAAVAFCLAADGPRAPVRRHALWGPLLVFAPILLWLAAGTLRRGAEFLEVMLVHQNVDRAMDAFKNQQPPWYFLVTLPVLLLPWTPFLPQAILAAARDRICGVRPLLLPLAWLSTTVLLFSVISSKKSRYMLPLTPAVALLVAGFLMRWHLERSGELRRGRVALILAGTAGLLAASAIGLAALAGQAVLPPDWVPGSEERGPGPPPAAVLESFQWPGNLRLLLPALILAGGCALSIRLALARSGRSLAAFLAGWLVFMVTAGILWTPIVNEMKSYRIFAEEIRERARGAPIRLLLSRHAGAINFYLPAERIPLVDLDDDVAGSLAEEGALLIATRRDLGRIEDLMGTAFRLEHCRGVGRKELCLASVSRGD